MSSLELLNENKTKEQLKAERRAAFEKQLTESGVLSKIKNDGKSKAQLRKERRALQESQRASKNAAKPQELKENESKISLSHATSKKQSLQSFSNVSSNRFKNIAKDDQKSGQILKISAFPNIPRRVDNIDNLIEELFFKQISLHPSIIKVGLRMNKDVLTGSLSRCISMLIALIDMINDYITPSQKDFARGIESKLDECVKFLHQCRPISVSMSNALHYVKFHLNKITPDESEVEARKNLTELIEKYIKTDIEIAIEAIAKDGASKLQQSDEVILTYGNSLSVKHVLHKALKDGKVFRVIVVDSSPKFLGKEMLKFLVKIGVKVSYIHISAIAYVIKEVTKVILGSHALLANGYVMATLGSSQIALVAKAFNIPVLVCCETFKFSDRVVTDSFVFNEAGFVEEFYSDLLNSSEKFGDRKNNLSILNIFYDVTPPNLINVLITEKGFLPCSSGPAVMRKNIGKLQFDF